MREVVEVTEVGNQGEGREEVEPWARDLIQKITRITHMKIIMTIMDMRIKDITIRTTPPNVQAQLNMESNHMVLSWNRKQPEIQRERNRGNRENILSKMENQWKIWIRQSVGVWSKLGEDQRIIPPLRKIQRWRLINKRIRLLLRRKQISNLKSRICSRRDLDLLLNHQAQLILRITVVLHRKDWISILWEVLNQRVAQMLPNLHM